MADITGAWLGTYWQAGNPTRFEATFAQASNSLSGRILDDGNLGEAQLEGSITGRQITFTKRYLNNSSYSIRYTGTLSEDEEHISGQWIVNARHAGPWEAQRSDNDLASELKSLMTRQVPATAAPV
ncbi:MAG: hypothetical protein F6J97_02675 [Leptolyngbya sp. SIO4C1]|nr:hypothetical protein [Leptolyngbya sp. SIO4C1]